MQIRCAIIDDEPIAAKGLQKYIDKTDFLELVALFHNPVEASIHLANQPVDLLFLDIKMPEMTGFELIQTLSKRPMIVLTTAYREFGPESFEVNALDYLMKPISFPRFLKAAHRAWDHFTGATQPKPVEEEPFIFVKIDGRYVKIQFEDILYFETDRDYVYIHTQDKRHMALLSLKQIEEDLPQYFMRCHRSFIVNKRYVDSIEGNLIRMGTHQIPVSRSFQDVVYETLIKKRFWKRGS